MFFPFSLAHLAILINRRHNYDSVPTEGTLAVAKLAASYGVGSGAPFG